MFLINSGSMFKNIMYKTAKNFKKMNINCFLLQEKKYNYINNDFNNN